MGVLPTPQMGAAAPNALRRRGAIVSLEARAEASGSRGDTIPVSNPTSHRRFRARVEGPGRVSVDSSLPKVNP